jgi:hypothetical protein
MTHYRDMTPLEQAIALQKAGVVTVEANPEAGGADVPFVEAACWKSRRDAAEEIWRLTNEVARLKTTGSFQTTPLKTTKLTNAERMRKLLADRKAAQE